MCIYIYTVMSHISYQSVEFLDASMISKATGLSKPQLWGAFAVFNRPKPPYPHPTWMISEGFPPTHPSAPPPPSPRRVHMRKGVVEVIEMEVHTFTMTPSLLRNQGVPLDKDIWGKKNTCTAPTNGPIGSAFF